MFSSLGILLTLAVFLVIITVSVVIHELAHYFNARSVGVPVRAFSVGMGPVLWRKQWRGTEWRLSLLPLGGYVDLKGLAPEQGEDGELYYPDDGFARKGFWAKFWVLIGGVVANFILAILLISVAITAQPNYRALTSGLTPEAATGFQQIAPDSPAERLGVEVGDIVLSVNGTQNPSVEEVQREIRTASQLSFVLERDGERVQVQTPWPPEDQEQPLFGVGIGPIPTSELPRLSYGAALVETTSFLVRTVPEYVTAIVGGFGQTLAGQRSEDIAGPVGMVTMTGQFARGGLISTLFFAGFINYALALFNALPIPGLDGGRILLSGIVALRGKPFKPGQEEFVNFLGIAFLMFFVVFITFGEVGDLLGIGG